MKLNLDVIPLFIFGFPLCLLLTCHSTFLGESPQPCLPYMEKVSAYARFDEITPHSLYFFAQHVQP